MEREAHLEPASCETAEVEHGDGPRPKLTLGPIKPEFALLWASETAFDLGAALMSFALGVWIFQRTGSAEQFSGTVLAAAAPALLMTPLAGAIADRFDRRWVIASCDIVSALMIATLASLLFQDKLAVKQLYFFNAGTAIIDAVRTPAYRAALSAIVPKDKLTFASGLVGLTQSVLHVVAPLIAGYLMGAIGLEGVVAVEVIVVIAGALAAFGALSRARHALYGMAPSARSSIVRGAAASFAAALRWLRDVPTMAGLAAYGVLQDSLLILATSMMTPLVLSTHTSEVMGQVLSCGALGGLSASAMLVVLRVNRRLMVWVLMSDAVLSLFVMLAGFAMSAASWCVCAFFALFAGTTSGACASALWMRKTPKATRGSIFALNSALHLLSMCVVMLAGGRLGEQVFEPALADGGPWADTVGAWMGTGSGRGLGFMFVISGAGSCLVSLLALAHARMRDLDLLTRDQHDDADESLTSRPSPVAT